MYASRCMYGCVHQGRETKLINILSFTKLRVYDLGKCVLSIKQCEAGASGIGITKGLVTLVFRGKVRVNETIRGHVNTQTRRKRRGSKSHTGGPPSSEGFTRDGW